jgi:hypothetical protein
MEAGVFGLVDHPHTTATQLLDDLIMRDGPANHGFASGQASQGKGMVVGSGLGVKEVLDHHTTMRPNRLL